MSPLQRTAAGLVIVFLGAPVPLGGGPGWRVYDLLADPVGWVLVVSGSHALARTDAAFGSTRALAVLAGVVSVPLWFPQVPHALDDSTRWFASLPQIAYCLWLCRQVGVAATVQDPPDAYAARRFGLLVWGWALVAVLPVLALGGRVTSLEGLSAVVSTVVAVALVYHLFRVHRRPWLGGPGPLVAGKVPDGSGKHDGRPPSR